MFVLNLCRSTASLLPSIQRALCCSKLRGTTLSNVKLKLFSSNVKLPIDNLNSLKADTVLYTLEKEKVIKLLTLYAVVQCGLCTFLGWNTFVSLKDTSPSMTQTDENESSADKSKYNLGTTRYRVMSSLGCFSLGIITAIVAYTVPTRIIKEIILCKGANVASIITYGPLGKTRHLKFPLRELHCVVTREEAKSYIPLKVKSRWLFFLIDCKGRFHHPRLFDLSVGAKSGKY